MDVNSAPQGEPSKSQRDKWMRFAQWYKSTPILRRVDPTAFFGLFLALMAFIIFPREHCKCRDLMTDTAILSMARQGDEEAQSFLKSSDNALLCASREQELIKKLKKQKKARVQRPKI